MFEKVKELGKQAIDAATEKTNEVVGKAEELVDKVKTKTQFAGYMFNPETVRVDVIDQANKLLTEWKTVDIQTSMTMADGSHYVIFKLTK